MRKIPGSILVVDDDLAHRTMLVTLLGGWGYKTAEADDGTLAVSAVAETPYDLVLMDVRMVKMSGIEALENLKSINPAVPVIIMTAYSSVESAVEALKKGAYDYLTKPLDFDTLRLTLERAMEHVRLKDENRRLREKLGQRFDRRRIIGRSAAMLNLLETVERVAGSEATVLLWGESGTGKELIAGAIHHNSPRHRNPFIRINCAAIPETLFESEVFGHEKGAFTGAERRKHGFFAQADGGTLFLDEISEMPLTMQVKLLRALQEREFMRVGGEQLIKVDVRVIAATNQGLVERVRTGRFREDLFYRLNVVSLSIPPLRDRREDIALLAQYFLADFAGKNSKDIKGFTPQAMDLAMKYGWPGNVRELMNAVERGVVLARGAYLEVEDLQLPVASVEDWRAPSSAAAMPLDQVEKATILKTLAAADNNKSEAARRLGITRKTLHKKLKLYGVML
jgi:two-component system response regulator HydG